MEVKPQNWEEKLGVLALPVSNSYKGQALVAGEQSPSRCWGNPGGHSEIGHAGQSWNVLPQSNLSVAQQTTQKPFPYWTF